MADIIITMPLMTVHDLRDLIEWAKVGLTERPTEGDGTEALIGRLEEDLYETNAQPDEDVCLRRHR